MVATGRADLDCANTTLATVQQTAAPALRVGNRMQVTNTGIELLRG